MQFLKKKICLKNNHISILQMLIHIAGSSGAGKSTLGQQIKENFNSKNVIVKDLDDFLYTIINEIKSRNKRLTYKQTQLYWKKRFTELVKNFIMSKIDNHIIFVGYNENYNTWVNIPPLEIKYPYEVYKYYIKLPDEQIMWQFFTRHANHVYNNTEEIFKNIMEGDVIYISKEDMLSRIKYDDKLYKKYKYQFKTQKEIYSEVVKLLKKAKVK